MSDITTGLNDLQPAIYAALAGVVVSAIVKIVNKLFDRRKERLDEHITLRRELREELDAVRDELHKLQSELDEWREKYYHQLELTNELKLDILKLTEELNDYKNQTGNFPILVEPSDK